MYLQSLEMFGFKSFAPRTILNFHRGVTAVVGPNGCGKSNVLDAMRWVLGEQSAKALRGGEMSDVIFSGTDSRPALGMAEVSLTFAECEEQLGVEWNEVRITRRVYRDGKSEYFLNKTACRLRDIHQLFMDTGVGRSAYSIMEQGKIDLILSSRPEDRRAIFEEAAGITKYKAQKKEALRKLDHTEANLLRVQDIVKEVGRQIGSLQRQASKARRYQSVMQDLRVFDTHLSHKNYRELVAERETTNEALERGEDARGTHAEEIVQREAELAGFRARMEELDVEMMGVREDVQNLKNQVFSAENRIVTNGERCEEARSLIERHRLDIASAEEKIGTQQNQLEETDQLLAQMIETLNAHESALNEQNARVGHARGEREEAERAIQDSRSEIGRAENRLGALRNDISAAAGRREASETRLRLLQGESDAAGQAAGECGARLSAIAERLDDATQAARDSQAEQSEAQLAYEEAQHARQAAESALNSVAKEAAGIESRLEVLRQLHEEGEGLDEGTQAVLRGLDNPTFFKAAIQGALADQIQVEERVIPAIESALGEALQTILFKNTDVAEAAMLTLSGKKLGKAAIVPRDWIRGQNSDAGAVAPAELPEGALSWARTCLKGSGPGHDLAFEMLDGVVVTETLEAAFRIKAAHPRMGVATLNGEFISREGIIRGGRTGENAGQSLLARKAQIVELDRELTRVIERLQLHTATRSGAVNDLDEAQVRLLAAREAFQHAQVEAASLQNERKLAEGQSVELERRRSTFAYETVKLGEALRASVSQVQDLESGIAEATQGIEHGRNHYEECERKVLAARERENAAVEELNEVRVRVATDRQQQESLNRQRGPMTDRLAELAELLQARRTDIDSYEIRIESLSSESANLQESMGAWQAEIETHEAKISGIQGQRREVQEGSESVEVALRSARKQLADLQEQKGRLEVRIAQMDMRIENIRDHVSHRYQTDLEAFEPDSYALLCSFRERTKKRPGSRDSGESTLSGEGESPSSSDESTTPEAASETVEAVVETEPAVELDWSRIEEFVAELTERVESMGPVNLDAIQEFDELEERQNFLEQQNADLVNSKAELLDVISKINRTTRELFAATFEKVRENFQVMFTELFGGGRADLMLVDDSDPLESGIEIIAKPPGKQLQSISLLSGGERTMTAVSLLFAIYMVKPSPFCVLDEMDAPLDESNISRFIKILDRFVDQSQFVVITHNKRTIGRADMLYGVTMQEHGVSKLVSVKFTSKDEVSAREKSIAETFDKHGNLHSETEEGKKTAAAIQAEPEIPVTAPPAETAAEIDGEENTPSSEIEEDTTLVVSAPEELTVETTESNAEAIADSQDISPSEPEMDDEPPVATGSDDEMPDAAADPMATEPLENEASLESEDEIGTTKTSEQTPTGALVE